LIHEITKDFANFKNLKNNGKDALSEESLEPIEERLDNLEEKFQTETTTQSDDSIRF
jgi:uncharacterized coiled-coil DUF342 family protein